MEFKYFRKPWLQAFKGAFFILLGIMAMLQVPNSLKSIGIFFSFFIGLTGFLLIVAPIILRIKGNQVWNILLGIIHLSFAMLIIFNLKQPVLKIYMIIVYWMILNSITELVEAGLLFLRRNSFFALFIINALLSALLGFGFFSLIDDSGNDRLFNMGFIALIFGMVYELSAIMLKSVKKPE
jgi:uncharacterized membrane protein HdeD (DUF308 family)